MLPYNKSMSSNGTITIAHEPTSVVEIRVPEWMKLAIQTNQIIKEDVAFFQKLISVTFDEIFSVKPTSSKIATSFSCNHPSFYIYKINGYETQIELGFFIEKVSSIEFKKVFSFMLETHNLHWVLSLVIAKRGKEKDPIFSSPKDKFVQDLEHSKLYRDLQKKDINGLSNIQKYRYSKKRIIEFVSVIQTEFFENFINMTASVALLGENSIGLYMEGVSAEVDLDALLLLKEKYSDLGTQIYIDFPKKMIAFQFKRLESKQSKQTKDRKRKRESDDNNEFEKESKKQKNNDEQSFETISYATQKK